MIKLTTNLYVMYIYYQTMPGKHTVLGFRCQTLTGTYHFYDAIYPEYTSQNNAPLASTLTLYRAGIVAVRTYVDTTSR